MASGLSTSQIITVLLPACLHGDHLGSASLTTNAAGQKVSEQPFDPFGKLRVQLRAGCYKPYGEVRWVTGAGMPTDPSTARITGPLRAGFTFTSQRAGPANYVGSLMDYVARGYSPALGRFVSADMIAPGAGMAVETRRGASLLADDNHP